MESLSGLPCMCSPKVAGACRETTWLLEVSGASKEVTWLLEVLGACR